MSKKRNNNNFSKTLESLKEHEIELITEIVNKISSDFSFSSPILFFEKILQITETVQTNQDISLAYERLNSRPAIIHDHCEKMRTKLKALINETRSLPMSIISMIDKIIQSDSKHSSEPHTDKTFQRFSVVCEIILNAFSDLDKKTPPGNPAHNGVKSKKKFIIGQLFGILHSEIGSIPICRKRRSPAKKNGEIYHGNFYDFLLAISPLVKLLGFELGEPGRTASDYVRDFNNTIKTINPI